ncbi:MAG: acyl-CoA thioester hydrolase [Opitutales bacterium]|nr:acyl-CoA thioester hydrolase [Opitutales bacterium]
MICSETEIRVRYAETDKMGIAYHANYFTWFEVARVQMLDELGTPYRDLEAEGYLLPVLECRAKFLRSAFFDDLLMVKTFIEEPPLARIQVRYEVVRGEELLCKGETVHGFVTTKGEVTRPPARFVELARVRFQEQD